MTECLAVNQIEQNYWLKFSETLSSKLFQPLRSIVCSFATFTPIVHSIVKLIDATVFSKSLSSSTSSLIEWIVERIVFGVVKDAILLIQNLLNVFWIDILSESLILALPLSQVHLSK